MSAAPQAAELDLASHKGRVPVELLGRSAFPPIGDLPYFITLSGYGFYWFLLAEETQAPQWHEPYVQPLPEFRTLVLSLGWDSIGAGTNAGLLQQAILPEFLPNQRWFAAKGQRIERVAIADTAVLSHDGEAFLLLTLDAFIESGEAQRYLLPLAIAWESAIDDPFARLHSYTLARARTGGRIGAIHDAVAGPGLARAVVAGVRDGLTVPTRDDGRLIFRRTKAFPEPLPLAEISVERMGGEQSNTSLKLGEEIILKLLRRLAPGVHPEVEVGRFLTEVAGYTNVPPLLGSVEHIDAEGVPTALVVLQGFVRNQGDGWEFTLDHLDRVLGQLEFLPSGVDADPAELYGEFCRWRKRSVDASPSCIARSRCPPTMRRSVRSRPDRLTSKPGWRRCGSRRRRHTRR